MFFQFLCLSNKQYCYNYLLLIIEPKGDALVLLVYLCSYPHLWSQALGSEKNRIGGTSDWKELPPQGGDRVRSSSIREELGVEPLVLRAKRCSGHVPVEGGGPLKDSGHSRGTMSLGWPMSGMSVVLGSPWLVKNNPQVDWASRKITACSPFCYAHCFSSAFPPTIVTEPQLPSPTDLECQRYAMI